MKTFICEICKTPLGQVNLDDLKVPMTHDMFHSLMPERGIPVPVQPMLDWLAFRCRQCRARPFMSPHHITFLDKRKFYKRIDILKHKVVEKTRIANQKIIDAAFAEEPEPETFKEKVKNIIKPKTRKVIACKHCGKVYQKKTKYFKRHEAKCKG